MANPVSAQQRKAGSPEQAFGQVLKRVRQSRGLSQEELGFRSGYHRTYIGQLERGEKSPSLKTVFNLAATLRIRPSLLIHRTEQVHGRVPKTQ
jgi:transcriptional regulator with XRE-family HTH domain